MPAQPFFRSAAQALRPRRVNMDVPISLGVTLATLMSVYQSMRGSEQVYFDAAMTLLFFLLVGRFLDQRMRARAAGAAANLIGLAGIGCHRHPSRWIDACACSARAAGARDARANGGRRALCRRRPRGGGAGEVDQSLITGESTPCRVARRVDLCRHHQSVRTDGHGGHGDRATTHCSPRSRG